MSKVQPTTAPAETVWRRLQMVESRIEELPGGGRQTYLGGQFYLVPQAQFDEWTAPGGPAIDPENPPKAPGPEYVPDPDPIAAPEGGND